MRTHGRAMHLALAMLLSTLSCVSVIPSQASLPAASSVKVQQRRNPFDRAYNKAWRAIKNNYVYRDKLNDWDKWQNKFAGKLKNGTQLNEAVEEMISSLNDDYTYVLSADAIKTRTKEHNSKNVVHHKMLNNNVAYIKVDNISSNKVLTEFRRALVRSQGAEGLVLDLRDNHGGFITIAQEMFALLADEGLFMSYQGFGDGKPDTQEYRLKREHWIVTENGAAHTDKRQRNLSGTKPIVIVVNKDTRSAAELLAGALRDVGRARLVGEKTYGKGVLQDAYDVTAELQVKVTTARYFLPNGECIHEVGITPDDLITSSKSEDHQLTRATALLRNVIAQDNTRRRQMASLGSNGANL